MGLYDQLVAVEGAPAAGKPFRFEEINPALNSFDQPVLTPRQLSSIKSMTGQDRGYMDSRRTRRRRNGNPSNRTHSAESGAFPTSYHAAQNVVRRMSMPGSSAGED